MRRIIFALLIGMAPLAGGAGAIARQYAPGFEGVSWGDSLAELVAKHPGGDHYFAYGGGQRDYNVSDETPLFGISRSNMRVNYFFDETDSVVSVAVGFPYEQRAKLLGALTLSFGSYKRMYTKGISAVYEWASDDGTGITVWETLDPSYGILRLLISGPNSSLLKNPTSNCANQTGRQKPKK
jgi:hypothetical protein